MAAALAPAIGAPAGFNPADYGVYMMKVGAMNASEQLMEMAAGKRTKFDVSAMVTAMAAASVNAAVNSKVITSRFAQSIVNTVTDNALASALARRRMNIDATMLQAIGASVLAVARDRVDHYELLRQEVLTKETRYPTAYARAQQASRGTTVVKKRATPPVRTKVEISDINVWAEANAQDAAFTKIPAGGLDLSWEGRARARSTIVPEVRLAPASRASSVAKTQGSTSIMFVTLRDLVGDPYTIYKNTSTLEKAVIIAGAATLLAPEAVVAAVGYASTAFTLGPIAEASILAGPMADAAILQSIGAGGGLAAAGSKLGLFASSSEIAVKSFLARVVAKPSLSFFAEARVGVGGERYGNQLLHHSEIKFSQTSVSNVDVITESMKTHGWKGAPIDVVKLPDGTLVSVDNTRLLAASRADILVKTKVHDFAKPLTQDLAERFTTKQGGVPNTWGEAVQNRIGKQNYIYRDTYPNGSYITGTR